MHTEKLSKRTGKAKTQIGCRLLLPLLGFGRLNEQEGQDPMTYRNPIREQAAAKAAEVLMQRFGIETAFDKPKIGLVLGTGWGDTFHPVDQQRCSFQEIDGLGGLDVLAGHARKVVYGSVHGNPVIALSGRIHMNESPSPEHGDKVRLHIEMLARLGVKKFIFTAAVGSLTAKIPVGSIVGVDGFVTLYAPDMPLKTGEFVSPEDMLIKSSAANTAAKLNNLEYCTGGHVMVRGPFFEGRKYDKRLLAASGASVVGMSILPETCVAALYDIPVLALGFVTNTAVEEHSHKTNQERSKNAAKKLGEFLDTLISFTTA